MIMSLDILDTSPMRSFLVGSFYICFQGQLAALEVALSKAVQQASVRLSTTATIYPPQAVSVTQHCPPSQDSFPPKCRDIT